MVLLEILAWSSLVFWLGLTLDRRRRWPWEAVLPVEDVGGEDLPAVAAVVPARDEAEVLPRTLPALLGQDLPHFTVVLVDDQSTDGTAAVAREVAAAVGRPDRLRVITAPPPPPGWTGKVHALAVGVAAVDAPWLLLTDADIGHRPGSVAALLAQAARGYDLVSVMARLSAGTRWERLLIPPFVFFFQLLYPFRRVADRASPVAAAAGGCILVRREALAAAGGIGAVRGAVIDDVALGRAVKEAGGLTWLGFDPGIVSARPYRRLADLWAMVQRSAFVQLRYRWELLVLVLAGLAALVSSPPVVVAVALWGLGWGPAAAAEPLARAAVAAGLAWGLQAAALLPSVRHHRVPAGYAVTLPLAAVFYGAMTFCSAWDHWWGRGSRWKGRSYPATGA
jgi:hopene-associated glycosyltransferase HpnB